MIRNRPAAVSEYLLICQPLTGNSFAEHRNRRFDRLILRQRTSPAKIAQSPTAMSDQCVINRPLNHCNNEYEPPSSENGISIEHRIA